MTLHPDTDSESAAISMAADNGASPDSVDTDKTAPDAEHNGSDSGRSATAPPRPKPAYGNSPTALQDAFLNGLRRENIDVVVYFCDGSQERGAVRAFDTFTILLENRNSGKSQLLYKHSVARIFPTRSPSNLSLGPDRSKR